MNPVMNGVGNGVSPTNNVMNYDVVNVTGLASKQGDEIYIYGRSSTQQGGGMLLGATKAAPIAGPFSADAADYTFEALVPSNLYSKHQIVVYDYSSNKVLSPIVTVTHEQGATGATGARGVAGATGSTGVPGNITVGFQVNNPVNIIGGTGNIAVAFQVNNQVNIAISSSNLIQGGAQTNINNAGNLAIGTTRSIFGPGTTIDGSGSSGHTGVTAYSNSHIHAIAKKSNGYSHQKTIASVNQNTIRNGKHKPTFLAHSIGSTGSTSAIGGLNHLSQAAPSVLSVVNTFTGPKDVGFLKTPTSGQNAHGIGAIVPNEVSHLAVASMSSMHGNDPHAITVIPKLS